MPIERDGIIVNSSEQWRPTLVDDGTGNLIPNGPEVKITSCVSGVIPRSIRHDAFREIAGGNINLQRWLVVVRGASTLASGDSIHVLQGPFIGRYRAEVVETVPNETLILAQCLKEA
jgi:hypothetical protein